MKKMIKIAFVAAFAAIAGYGVYANQKTDVMSEMVVKVLVIVMVVLYMQLVSVKIGDGVDVKDNRLYTMFN